MDIHTNDNDDPVVTKDNQESVRERDNGENKIWVHSRYITQFGDFSRRDILVLEVLKSVTKTFFVPLAIDGGIKNVIGFQVILIPISVVANHCFKSGTDEIFIGTDTFYATEKKYYELGGKENTYSSNQSDT